MDKLSDLLPNDFLSEQKIQLGENFEKYIESINQKDVRGLRVNLTKISVHNFCEAFEKNYNTKLEKIPYTDDGFIFCGDEKVGGFSEHLSGLFYMQEPSSMIAVCSSGIKNEKKTLKILDLCASPGGKTGQIASIVSNDSIIFSNEIVKSRAEILYSNVERQGFKNVVILNESPENLKCFKGFFDYVFVDAPCSGEGMFRKDPQTISEWSKENVLMCAERQKDILKIAQSLVCSGGKLVYSTCTFSAEEDENIVEWFLQNFDYKICDVPNEIKSSTIASKANIKDFEFARKFYPFSGKGEGQFVAVFENLSENVSNDLYSKKHYRNISQIGQSENKLVKEFSQSSLTEEISWKSLFRTGDNIYFVPESFDPKIQTALEDLKFVSIGVKLGQIEKNRFEPNHFCFMALQDLFKNKIELDDEDLKRYFHGEELGFCGQTKGYGVVTKNGFAVGGVKIAGNRLKNLYPKGLRK